MVNIDFCDIRNFSNAQLPGVNQENSLDDLTKARIKQVLQVKRVCRATD